MVAVMTLGEGFSNYHYAFPEDYKTSELRHSLLNTTTAFIDFFAKIGWAYDLKAVPENRIKKRALKTGNGSHPVCGVGVRMIT